MNIRKQLEYQPLEVMIHEIAGGEEHLRKLAPKVECLSSFVPKSLTIKEERE